MMHPLNGVTFTNQAGALVSVAVVFKDLHGNDREVIFGERIPTLRWAQIKLRDLEVPDGAEFKLKVRVIAGTEPDWDNTFICTTRDGTHGDFVIRGTNLDNYVTFSGYSHYT